jgi:pilus assembly protein FimV
MGLRTQTIILSVATTLASPFAAALGLGEIKLKSSLNQPLYAEIQLQQTRDLTDREILVGLASQADFDRVGVEKPLFLGDLKFQVVMEGGAGPVVRVTSSKPILEPYLNFIVQAQWPSGKLLREYTLLVDLPVYSGDLADSVTAARSTAVDAPRVQTQIEEAPPTPRPARPATARAAKPKPAAPKPAPAPEPEANNPPAGPEPRASAESYGPVSANDTLWKIAKANRPAGASIQQTMLAIQRLNPDAFINGNINLLRKGQVLRLPEKDAIAQVDASTAQRQVAATAPARKVAPDDESNGPQLDASKNLPQTDNKPTAVEGRVKLSASGSAEGSKSGRGTGGEPGSKEALSNELSITKEELDAKTRESTDIKTRVKAVDEQIENTQKLIDVNSAELAKLELAIQKNNQPTAEAAAQAPADVADLYKQAEGQPAAPAADQPAPAQIGPDGKVVTAEPAPSAEPAPTVEPAPATEPAPSAEAAPVAPPVAETPPPAPAEPPAPTKAPANPVADKGLVDKLLDNILYLAGGAAALIGLGVLVVMRRRRDADDGDDGLAPSSGGGDDGWNFDVSLPGFDEPDTTKLADPAADLSDLRFEEPEQKIKLETDDVVSESDIHIALKDFDTAEKLLLNALEQDPANSRVLLKLLEIYSRKNDLESFDRQYAKLRSFGDADSVERAEQLRGYIEGAPAFDAGKYGDESFLAAINADVPSPIEPDITRIPPAKVAATAAVVAAAVAAPAMAEPQTEDLEFDAVLDDEPSAITQVTPALALADDDFALDFGDIDPPAAESPAAPVSSDRGSLADMLASVGSEDDLDLSDFDDLTLGASATKVQDDLSEADYELDELALDNQTLTNDFAPDGLSLDHSLDAGFDDFDDFGKTPLSTATEEPEDEFAGMALGELDDEVDLSSLEAALPGDTDADADARFDFDDIELDSPAPVAEDAGLDLLQDADDDQDYAALDFDLRETDAEGGLADDLDSFEAKTLVMPAISDADIASATGTELDFDDLDADLGALAKDFSGDFADLDDLDTLAAAPASAPSADLSMEEPITDFGELDDIDPDLVLGDKKPARDIDLGDFDDSVTFPIEDPKTDLDEDLGGWDLAKSSTTPSASTAADTDLLDDAVEFEGLDDLDALADVDLLDDSVESLLPEDDLLDIPAAKASVSVAGFDIPDFDPESDDDSDLGGLCDGDELATKLDLLRAFVDMGDEDSARHTLEEILEEGSQEQRQQAEDLFARLS